MSLSEGVSDVLRNKLVEILTRDEARFYSFCVELQKSINFPFLVDFRSSSVLGYNEAIDLVFSRRLLPTLPTSDVGRE